MNGGEPPAPGSASVHARKPAKHAAIACERGRSRSRAWLVILALVLVILAVLRLGLGSSGLGFPSDSAILADRAGRLVASALVGGALSLSGVMLQALLANPLADPFVLGLASGAGLGVSIRRWLALAWAGSASLWAILGAAGACVVVVCFGRRKREGGIEPIAMILAGVVVGVFCAACTMLVGQLAGPGARDEFSRWMLGAIQPVPFAPSWENWGAPGILALALAAGLAWLLWRGAQVDAATLPEDEARSLGLPLGRLRFMLFAWSAALAGASVVLAGPVAFVGLIAPHVARTLVGPRHRVLSAAAVLAGAGLVVLGDVAGAAFHLATGRGVVPVGVFTALLGGPAFLWMLRRR